MKLHSSLPYLATQIGRGGNFRSFLPLRDWAVLKAKGHPWEPQDRWIAGFIMGCSRDWGLFRNTCQKESQRPIATQCLTWGTLFYPTLVLLITHSPPYAFTLISLGPSEKHTVINTLQSKGTKNSVKNPYGKLLCLKHQLINSQKHHKCLKSSIAFTSHKWESWTMELNWLACGHQGKSVSE